ncbi:MAG TPA: response regulator [candidate division Zixibacteria bacterium]|nr:response regulator [candidate division Zixibacteria bacterium]
MRIGEDKPSLLVVDDEKYICGIIVEALASENYETVAMSDPAEALAYIENNPVDLVLTDLVMGEFSGIQVLESTLTHHEDAAVILMTAHPTVQTAISVLKKGAFDFLIKPFKLELLRATIRRGLSHQRIVRENLHLRGQVEFLKVAGTAGAEVDIDEFLSMVVRSCRKEMSACAAGLIEVNPKTNEIVRRACEAEHESLHAVVLDESTLEHFNFTKSSKPIISSEPIEEGGMQMSRIYISQPIFSRRKLHGVINLLIKARFDRLTQGQINVLNILANSAAATMTNFALYQDLRQSYLQAIRGLAQAIEARDEYTAGHTDRVSRLAESIARELGWSEKSIEALAMGCTLHDIGKIAIPDSVLNKPGKLTEEEHKLMLDHPNLGLNIIQGIDLFRPAEPYIVSHHEAYDGSGYPLGLAGEDIPIEGRLLSVADTFDAIVTDRPYRKGADLDVAVSELIKYKGKQFDPDLVEVFLDLIADGKIDLKTLYDREFDLSVVNEIRATETAPA